jgi:hypothetical protein
MTTSSRQSRRIDPPACRKFKLDHIGDVVRPTLAKPTRALPFGRRAASARPSSTIGAPAMVHPVSLQRSRARSSKRLSTDSRGTVSHFAFAVWTPFDQHLPRACLHAVSACGSEKRRIEFRGTLSQLLQHQHIKRVRVPAEPIEANGRSRIGSSPATSIGNGEQA